MASTIYAPAPWQLQGKGCVLLYHFPHSFVAQWGFLDEYQHQHYRGWLGAVMLIDYERSNVGPYQELLFIPGLFQTGEKLSFSISKIWVSSEASQQNGQRNWGIPKELANFKLHWQAGGLSSFEVNKKGRPFFEARLKSWGPSLPFTSKMVPLARIVQPFEHKLLQTSPAARGKLQLASLQKISADENFFPPLQRLSPLACFSLNKFQMQFPIAQVLKRNY